MIQPFELLKSLTTTTTPAEILGVQSFTAYHSCCQCEKKIILEKSTVITCNIYGIKQKVKSTTEQCYIDVNAAKVTVTLFHDIIKNLLISQGKHGLPINEDNVTSLFLKLLTLSSSCENSANWAQNKHLFNTCRNSKTKTLNVLVIPTTKINFFYERERVNFLQFWWLLIVNHSYCFSFSNIVPKVTLPLKVISSKLKNKKLLILLRFQFN